MGARNRHFQSRVLKKAAPQWQWIRLMTRMAKAARHRLLLLLRTTAVGSAVQLLPLQQEQPPRLLLALLLTRHALQVTGCFMRAKATAAL